MSYSFTVHDAIDHLRDWTGGDASNERVLRQAVQSAYRDVTQYRKWRYLITHYRIQLSAAYSTGTIVYDHTGGSNEREVTLSSGTWPSWAGSGILRVSDVSHIVATRESGTVLTLHSTVNPGADIAAGTSYELLRPYYTLPEDFIAFDDLQSQNDWWQMRYIQPADYLLRVRQVTASGPPAVYTVMADPLNPGRLAVWFDPAPGEAKTMDFYYHRRPRELTYSGKESRESVGTVTVDGSPTASATVTGTGTSFESGMVGSVIRFSADNANSPGGRMGPYGYAYERKILTYSSATSITVDSTIGADLNGVKYRISDPIDIAPNLHEAFLRALEYQAGILRRSKNDDRQTLQAAYLEALNGASAADAPSYGLRYAGDGGSGWPGELPLGDDDE